MGEYKCKNYCLGVLEYQVLDNLTLKFHLQIPDSWSQILLVYPPIQKYTTAAFRNRHFMDSMQEQLSIFGI